MFDNYFNQLLRWRWLVILITIICIGAMASGIQRLKFTSDFKVFFKKNNPHLIALENLQDTYVKSENVFITIAPIEGDVFTRNTLTDIKELTELAWQTPYVIRVDSLTNFQHTQSQNDELIVGDLVEDPSRLSDEQLLQIRSIALQEPLLKNWLISPDGKFTGINITVELPGINDQIETPKVANAVRQMLAEFQRQHPALEFHLTGGVMMNNAFPEASQRDVTLLTPLMYLVIFIALAILFQSLWATLACLTVILLSIIAAMGAAGWLGIKLSPPSASAPTIILTVAVADCVHFFASFFEASQKSWVSPDTEAHIRGKAVKDSLQINLQPIFLTSLTTALGFLSLNFGESPPFHDLGNIVAIGVVVAFVSSVAFLPALTVTLPLAAKPHIKTTSKMLEKLGDWVILNRHRVLLGSVLVVLGLASAIPLNSLDDEPLAYFAEDNTFRMDTEYTTEHLTGLYVIDYSIPSNRSGGVSDPKYLKLLDQFSEWLRNQPEVLHVYSIVDIFKRLNQNLHANDPNFYTIPVSSELAAQYLLIYEMALPMGMDLNDRINLDKSATRISVRIKNLSSKAMLDFESRAQAWLHQHFPPSMISPGTGGNIIFANIGMTNIKSMLNGTIVAFFIIAGILIITLRSVSLGLLSLIPNLAPSIMAFGLWGVLDGQINMGVAAVTGLTMGIVVDDTVHFLSKYLHAVREKGMDRINAVRYSFSNVGTAIWITSAVLVTGFLVLTLSDFTINAKLGLLSSITIGFALLADLFLLPALLLMGERHHDANISHSNFSNGSSSDPSTVK